MTTSIGRPEFPGEEHYVVSTLMVMVRTTRGNYLQLFDGAPVPANVDPHHRDHLLAGGMIRLRDDAPLDLREPRHAVEGLERFPIVDKKG